jgi:DNA-binding transcriptional ArsR family regulator
VPAPAETTGAILNRMVQYQVLDDRLDRTFAALADPKRRDILDRLGRGPASISELARPSGMSLTGMKKHVQILEGARLVTTEKVGRTRQCRLGPERLEDAARWIRLYRQRWERRLDGLESYLARRKGDRR